jgi:hypothetical protein
MPGELHHCWGRQLVLWRLEVSLPLLKGWADPEIDLDLELIRFRFFRLYAQDHHPLDKIINRAVLQPGIKTPMDYFSCAQ